MRARSIRRATSATLVLAVAFVAVPVLLVTGSNRRFGHASPLHGMDAPWRWTLDSARSWGRRLTGDLDTSRELIDLFLRVGLVVAWICVAMLTATIVSETVFQLRHGMPSSGQRSLLGLGWLARMTATGLVALVLPLAAGSTALAGGPSLPRSSVMAPFLPSARPGTSPAPEPAPQPGWSTYEVQRGDSVWSIAARLAATDDVHQVAQQIVDANRGATMVDGRRFSTPALIEPGWRLLVPATDRSPAPPATANAAATATATASGSSDPVSSAAVDPAPSDPLSTASTTVLDASTTDTATTGSIVAPTASGAHEVVAGDSYWRIAAAHLAALTGAEPPDHDVLVATQALIAHNAPLLDHRDPRLILPGERVELEPVTAHAPSVSSVEPAAEQPVASVPSPSPPAVDDQAIDAAPAKVAPAATPAADDPAIDATAKPVPVAAPVATPAPVAAATPPEPAVVATRQLTGATSPPEPAVVATRQLTGAATPTELPVVSTPQLTGAAPPNAPPVGAAHGAAAREGTGMPIPISLGLGGAVIVATGAIALLEARRRHRARSARVGARLAPVSDRDVATELALRAASAPERLARLDLALRAAALDLADAQARVFTAEVADDGDIRLVLDGSATPTGSTWRLDLEDGSWVLPGRISTEVLAESARHAGMPCPALAHLGSTADGQLFADLEAFGVLHVDVAGPFGRDIVRCLAASMALSPFASTAHVVTVGLEAELALGTIVDVQQADSLDAALELAAERLGTTRTIAAGTSTFALRARSNGGESWEPAIVFAGTTEIEPFDSAHAGNGLAVVSVGHGALDETDGETTCAMSGETVGVSSGEGHDDVDALGVREWSLCVRDDRFVLQPLGIALTPCGLGQHGVLDVRALLATAEQPLELRARVVPIDATASDATRSDRDWRQPARWLEDVPADAADVEPSGAFVEPAWSLLVRLLGHVDVVTAAGESTVFERSKALELVVWLSQHRQRPTRAGARTALWDVEVRDATFANVVSDARRAMARTLAPPAGEEWLARTLTEELPLHHAVRTDADVLAARVDHARGMSARRAIAVLRPGLELVSGMPFAGTSFLWTDAEGLATSLTLLIVGAATDLANHHLAIGDAEGVFWATGQGLKALPGHEELIALRMRAHARAGDLSGVRHEWEAYERALDADSWAVAQPSPKLIALRRDLLGAASAAVS